MPTCPAGIPQSLCDTITAAVDQALAAQGGAAAWNAADVLTTFKQWWGDTPISIPAPPDVAGRLGQIMQAAGDFWAQAADQNPTEARALPPNTWQFPWQYASPQTLDAQSAIATAMQAMSQDPLAQAYLTRGALPPFDPAKMDWTTPLWSDATAWPGAAAGVAAMVPALQQFAFMGSKCGFFSANTPAVIEAAWQSYLASGYLDPCEGAVTAAPTAGAQELPALPAATNTGGSSVTIVTPPGAPEWQTALLAAAGVAAAGGLWWAMTHRPRSRALAFAR